MLTINETIEAVKNGGAWIAIDDILYHLECARTLEAENKRLTEANAVITDQMAAYRMCWGGLYKEKYGNFPEYPF